MLQALPQDARVILASDREGNNYSPLDSEWSRVGYYPTAAWYGECEFPDDDSEDGQTIEEILNDERFEDAVVLWPIN